MAESKTTWADELAEAEEALRFARVAATGFWMALLEALNDVYAAEKQLIRLRVDGPSEAGAREEGEDV